MFEFLFKYPPAVFARGRLLFLSQWPLWALLAASVAVLAVLAWRFWQREQAPETARKKVHGGPSLMIWGLQALTILLLLVMLWRPAMSVAALAEKQVAIAVAVDDSSSMLSKDDGTESRLDRAKALIDSSAMKELRSRYQVRQFRVADGARRIEKPAELTGSGRVTQLGSSLVDLLQQQRGVPLGAVVLISDGAENLGGIDRATLDLIRQRRVPIYTVGLGQEKLLHDVEVTDVSLPAKALAGSRITVYAGIVQAGFAGQRARFTVRDGATTIATKEITLGEDGVRQVESVLVRAGDPGAHVIEASIDPLKNELNVANNRRSLLTDVRGDKRRILYLEGEPRWEMKFIRRALEDDPEIELVSALRTTQNKIYRQGVNSPDDLKDGFPASVQELFAYQGLILGTMEPGSFSAAQQELIRQFVDRRGGGLLFLGGRTALSESGWGTSPLADLLPVDLPAAKQTFRRDLTPVRLTAAGIEHPITRLVDDVDANQKRWTAMPALANAQDVGRAKPGAQVLLDAQGLGPSLVLESFGRGRTAVFGTAGSWRWAMLQDHSDGTHRTFWQQIARWLVGETPGPVTVSASRTLLLDDGAMELRSTVRDENYSPASDAEVVAEITGPNGLVNSLHLFADPKAPGEYVAKWTAPTAGSYLASVKATRGGAVAGTESLPFRRDDGVAEGFQTRQNRDFLERLAGATGGRYYTASDFDRLTKEVTYSDTGISLQETRELWDMPALFLTLILLKGGEWLLRRKWGVV